MKLSKNKFDVVIVGAGPGGLAASIELGKNNKKVLLIEKNKNIGQKVCAGGLTIKDFELGLPKKLVDKNFCEVTSHTPLQTSVLSKNNSFMSTINREKLGQWMKQIAIKYGIEIIHDEVTSLNKKNSELVLQSGKKINYNILIGADGSNSLIRKKLKIPQEKVMAVYQYLVKKVYPKMEVFFDVKNFGPSYVWIFPHKNFTSVGSGCDPKLFSIEKNKKNFESWLRENKIDIANAKYEAWMINYDYRGFQFDNIFLVGDAAGFASGLTGEGIYFAIVSGIEAAKKIIDKNYNLENLNKILKIKKIHEDFLNTLEHQSIGNFELEMLNLILKAHLANKIIIKNFI